MGSLGSNAIKIHYDLCLITYVTNYDMYYSAFLWLPIKMHYDFVSIVVNNQLEQVHYKQPVL